jgi:hypothetical protein
MIIKNVASKYIISVLFGVDSLVAIAWWQKIQQTHCASLHIIQTPEATSQILII